MDSDKEKIEGLYKEIEASLKKNLLIERAVYIGGTLGIITPITWLSLHFNNFFIASTAAVIGLILIIFFVRRYNLTRKITTKEISSYMDDRFSLKERAVSKVELEKSNPTDERVSLINHQIASITPNKREYPPLKLPRTSIALLSIFPIPWLVLSWIFITEVESIKNKEEVELLKELAEQVQGLPKELKDSLEDLSDILSKEDVNSDAVKEALTRSERALKEAIDEKESAKSDSMEVAEVTSATPSPSPTPTSTPKLAVSPTPPTQEKKEPENDQKSSDSESDKDSKKDEQGEKKDDSSKSSQQAKEGDGKDQEKKDGGKGKGGSSDNKGEGKDSKAGQGKGESESKEESKSLEGVGKALEEIKEKSESKEKGEKGDKGSQNKEDSQTPEDKEGDKGEKGDQGKGDNKDGASEEQNKDSKEKGAGQGDKEKEPDKKESKEEGKGTDKDSDSSNKKESNDKKGGEDKKESGEKGEGDKASSLPNGVQLVPTPPNQGGESDGSPKTLEEVSVPGKDETLDTRFTGDTKERVKNEKSGESKVSLSDVKLSKPEDGASQEGQYVPPEYSGILK